MFGVCCQRNLDHDREHEHEEKQKHELDGRLL